MPSSSQDAPNPVPVPNSSTRALCLLATRHRNNPPVASSDGIRKPINRLRSKSSVYLGGNGCVGLSFILYRTVLWGFETNRLHLGPYDNKTAEPFALQTRISRISVFPVRNGCAESPGALDCVKPGMATRASPTKFRTVKKSAATRAGIIRVDWRDSRAGIERAVEGNGSYHGFVSIPKKPDQRTYVRCYLIGFFSRRFVFFAGKKITIGFSRCASRRSCARGARVGIIPPPVSR